MPPFCTTLDPQEGWTLLLPSLQADEKLRGASGGAVPAQGRSKGPLVPPGMPGASPPSHGVTDIPAPRCWGEWGPLPITIPAAQPGQRGSPSPGSPCPAQPSSFCPHTGPRVPEPR